MVEGLYVSGACLCNSGPAASRPGPVLQWSTPTMPSASSCTASVTIRSTASSRALYMAWLRTVSSTDCFHPAYCRPMWYMEVPITRPRGTNPLSRTRTNSSTLRSEVKHLP
jgi:hypothetical protein